MKAKRMTYVLFFVVIMVWGIILYRIFNASGDNGNNSSQTTSIKLKKEPYNDYSQLKDTTRLLLNYRDPFGLIKQKDTSELTLKTKLITSLVARPVKLIINWGFIKYSGYIRNPASKKIIALLSVNGKNIMLAEGESAEHIKLLKNMRDSIKVNYNGKTKFITMNQKAL